MNKAWRCSWGGIEGIVAAASRGKAAARTMLAVGEAGYDNRSWKTLRVRRAPEYDAWAATVTTFWAGETVRGEDDVKSLLQAKGGQS